MRIQMFFFSKSVVENITCAVHSRKQIPHKHLKLGLALKGFNWQCSFSEGFEQTRPCCQLHGNWTSQKRIILLYYFFYLLRKKRLALKAFKLDNRCVIGVVQNNYDWIVNTQRRKEALHDTVGIVYQLATTWFLAVLHWQNLLNVLKAKCGYSMHTEFILW